MFLWMSQAPKPLRSTVENVPGDKIQVGDEVILTTAYPLYVLMYVYKFMSLCMYVCMYA